MLKIHRGDFSDMMLPIWNIETKSILETASSSGKILPYCKSIAFSPDDRMIAMSCVHHLIIWDTIKKKILSAQKHSYIRAVAFNPNGKRIVVGGDDFLEMIDSIGGLNKTASIMKINGSIISVAFSPDGKRIVSSDTGGGIRIWDADLRSSIVPPTTGSYTTIKSVVFSSDSKRIVGNGADGTIRIWEGQTGALIGTPVRLSAMDNTIAFSPDDKLIVRGNQLGKLDTWDISPESHLKILCNQLRYHPDLNNPVENKDIAHEAMKTCAPYYQ
jgi:WD40 repeat protein